MERMSECCERLKMKLSESKMLFMLLKGSLNEERQLLIRMGIREGEWCRK